MCSDEDGKVGHFISSHATLGFSAVEAYVLNAINLLNMMVFCDGGQTDRIVLYLARMLR